MSEHNALGFGRDPQCDENETVAEAKAEPRDRCVNVRVVERLRSALAAGTYQVPSALVAEALVRFTLTERGERRGPDCKLPPLGRCHARQVH